MVSGTSVTSTAGTGRERHSRGAIADRDDAERVGARGDAEAEASLGVGPGDRPPGQCVHLGTAHRVPSARLANNTLHDLLRARCHWDGECEETGKAKRSNHWIFSYRIVG